MTVAYETAPSLAPVPSFQPARVLIVDEGPMMRRALVTYLRERGYEAHECKAPA